MAYGRGYEGMDWKTSMYEQDRRDKESSSAEQALSGAEKIMHISDTFTNSLSTLDDIRERQLMKSGILSESVENEPLFVRQDTGKGFFGDWFKSQTRKMEDRVTINERALAKLEGDDRDKLMQVQDRLENLGMSPEEQGRVMRGNKTFDTEIAKQKKQLDDWKARRPEFSQMDVHTPGDPTYISSYQKDPSIVGSYGRDAKTSPFSIGEGQGVTQPTLGTPDTTSVNPYSRNVTTTPGTPATPGSVSPSSFESAYDMAKSDPYVSGLDKTRSSRDFVSGPEGERLYNPDGDMDVKRSSLSSPIKTPGDNVSSINIEKKGMFGKPGGFGSGEGLLSGIGKGGDRWGGKFGTKTGKISQIGKGGLGAGDLFTGKGTLAGIGKGGAKWGGKLGTGTGKISQVAKGIGKIGKGGIKGLFGGAGGAGGALAMGPAGWTMMALGLVGDKLFKKKTALGKIFSDVALKENLQFIGKSPSGIPVYDFNYIDDKTRRFRGVLAHDVPEVSSTHPSGYQMVDYSKIDVVFREVD